MGTDKGTLLGELSTNYDDSVPSSSFIGSLASAPSGDRFTVGFDMVSEIGSILKYDGLTKERSLLADANPELQRPIGILYAAQPVPEPFALGGWRSQLAASCSPAVAAEIPRLRCLAAATPDLGE